MTRPGYDYYGLLASTWDLWRDDTANWADRFLFLDIVRHYGEPVLDLGCGTGRILLDYLKEGINIDGVDNSPEMLAICRTKAAKMGLQPAVYQQSAEGLALPRMYRTILAPSSTLQLIADPDAALHALRRCAAHLQSGGALVAPFTFEWREGDPLDTGWELVFEKVRPEDGATVRHVAREWREPRQQLWHAESRFEVERDGKLLATEYQRRAPEGRWYTQAQVRDLFHAAGLANVQLLHAFTHEPARDDDRLFTAIGVKP